MKIIKSIIGGLSGAIALNILHETVKHFDHDAPRVDLVGEEALNKGLEAAATKPFEGNELYAATLTGDILSNAFYYSLIGAGKKKFLILRGLGYGLAAGVGALKLTKPLGLSDAPVTRTEKTKLLTVAYYTLGGLVTAFPVKALLSKSK